MKKRLSRQQRKIRQQRIWGLCLLCFGVFYAGTHIHKKKIAESYRLALEAFETWELTFELQRADVNRGDELPEMLHVRYSGGQLHINEHTSNQTFVGKLQFLKERRSLPVSEGDVLLQVQIVFDIESGEKSFASLSGFGVLSWRATQEIIPDPGGYLHLNALNSQVVFSGKIETETGEYVEIVSKISNIHAQYRPPMTRDGESRSWFPRLRWEAEKSKRGADFGQSNLPNALPFTP